MPLYEFICRSCGPFEALLTMREASASTRCPACHAKARRVLSLPAARTTASVTRRREKQSAAPHVIQRRAPESPPPPPAPHVQVSGRPWQLQHQRW